MRQKQMFRTLAVIFGAAVLLGGTNGCGKDEHYHSLSSKGSIKKINNDNKK